MEQKIRIKKLDDKKVKRKLHETLWIPYTRIQRRLPTISQPAARTLTPLYDTMTIPTLRRRHLNDCETSREAPHSSLFPPEAAVRRGLGDNVLVFPFFLDERGLRSPQDVIRVDALFMHSCPTFLRTPLVAQDVEELLVVIRQHSRLLLRHLLSHIQSGAPGPLLA